MQTEAGAGHGIVPSPRLFAVFGCSIFILIIVPIGIELAAFACFSIYRVFPPRGTLSCVEGLSTRANHGPGSSGS